MLWLLPLGIVFILTGKNLLSLEDTIGIALAIGSIYLTMMIQLLNLTNSFMDDNLSHMANGDISSVDKVMYYHRARLHRTTNRLLLTKLESFIKFIRVIHPKIHKAMDNSFKTMENRFLILEYNSNGDSISTGLCEFKLNNLLEPYGVKLSHICELANLRMYNQDDQISKILMDNINNPEFGKFVKQIKVGTI